MAGNAKSKSCASKKSKSQAARLKAIRQAKRKKRKLTGNQQQVQEALSWLAHEKIFDGVLLHGNTSWQCASLLYLSLLWIWSPLPQLTEAFVDARSKSEKLIGKAAVTTYQGLLKALLSVTPKLMPVLQKRMHELMEQLAGKFMRVNGFVPIAVDGSKLKASRTLSNEAAFHPANYGQGKNAKHRKRKRPGTRNKKGSKSKLTRDPPAPPAPHVWLTMMWHMGFCLPWCWKLGPSNTSEREHVKEMLQTGHFLEDTLFVGDAGFVGYQFWQTIIDMEHQFIVRVGANVKLLTELCTYKRDGKCIVYCWPKESMKAGCPPLRLRIVKCKIGKNENVWLLTSVVEKSKLSDKKLVTLYKQRWGVELQFRSLKQTFSKRKLRCRSGERVLIEAEWSIFGMAAVELMALKQQSGNKSYTPCKLSFSKALSAVRHGVSNHADRPDFMDDLQTELKKAVTDDYARKKPKAARLQLKSTSKTSCGVPKIQAATKEQRKRQIDLRKSKSKTTLQNAA